MEHPCVYTEMLAKASHMTTASCMEPEKGNLPLGSHLDRNTDASLARSSKNVKGEEGETIGGLEGRVRKPLPPVSITYNTNVGDFQH